MDQVSAPAGTTLAGYAALLRISGARAPAISRAAVSERRIKLPRGSSFVQRDDIDVYDSSYAPTHDFDGHLLFALKNERPDLGALKAVFERTPAETMENFVRQGPTGRLRRLGWFFYEWLTGNKLGLPDLDSANYIDAIDPDLWHAATPINSARHRVRDNLPGVPGFCPLIQRDVTLGGNSTDYVNSRGLRLFSDHSSETVRRMTRRLLLKDSRSTFLIESERPSGVQQQRWAELVASAGDEPLSLDLMVRLQKQLFSDRRFFPTGLRHDNIFLGDRIDNVANPLWIGAKPEDLRGLVSDLMRAAERMETGKVDPIAQATSIGFGWVFVHPLADGNGRTHRYILQHVLSRAGLKPAGMTVPIANAIWQDMDGYSEVLNAFDAPRMPLIEWRATASGNVEVLNETVDLYRYFDATAQARFVAERVMHVLEHDIPSELEQIKRRDRAVDGVSRIVAMPDLVAEKLIAFVTQNNGRLSKGKRKKEFPLLTDDEVEQIEQVVSEIYEIEIDETQPHPAAPRP